MALLTPAAVMAIGVLRTREQQMAITSTAMASAAAAAMLAALVERAACEYIPLISVT
jgi:hypothetical protein